MPTGNEAALASPKGILSDGRLPEHAIDGPGYVARRVRRSGVISAGSLPEVGRHQGMSAKGQDAAWLPPSRHDRFRSRSRLRLKPQGELDLPDPDYGKEIGTLRPLARRVPRTQDYAGSGRAISVSKSKRNCAPSS